MKTYEEIFDGIFNSVPFAHMHMQLIHKKAAKAYAQQVAEDVRKRCLENVKATIWTEHGFSPSAYIEKDSILNTEIILP